MGKVTVTGGSLKGARCGDLPEAEVAKSAKSYRGDARFMQYCRQFMASKLIDGAEEPENTGVNVGPPESQGRPEYCNFCKGVFTKCFTKRRKRQTLGAVRHDADLDVQTKFFSPVRKSDHAGD